MVTKVNKFKSRMARKIAKLKPAKRKAAYNRRKFQLEGGYRVTYSISVKQNQIVFDHQKGEIFDWRPLIKSIYSLGPRKKVIAKINDVAEIKLGMQTANFIELSKRIEEDLVMPIDENLCLSIMFKNHVKTIDLIAPSVPICQKWYKKLLTLVETTSQYREIKQNFDLFLEEQFRLADRDKSGVISFNEALAMLQNLNIAFDEKEAQTLFEKANFRKFDSPQEDGLDFDEFIEFYNLISFTKSLQNEFACITKGQDMLNMTKFKKFLLNIQKVDANEVDQMSDQLIASYEPLEAHKANVLKNGHIVSCKGFRNMILSPEFDIVKKQTLTVHQDMGRPLFDYFIATSHNTYLAEDQLEGRSTTETYRIYLSQGCRSVELDVTDGDGDYDYEPVVFHKRTITTKMKLQKIVDTIAEYAFKNSPYPVIISLENNCKNLLSQRKTAKIFKNGFGDYLITKQLFGANESKMPSPEDLKHKIIIKGKRLPLKPGCNVSEFEIKHNLAKELSDLVWYGASKKFTSFDGGQWKYNQMTSIEEGKSAKYSKRQIENYRKFTSCHLVKVYPLGLRFFSGNYHPMPHWRAGAQMISLNYQTKGTPMELNQALFATNGSCGYVLKPQSMTSSAKTGLKEFCEFTIRVLCAFNLPIVGGIVDRIIDPYVQIRLFGAKQIIRKRRRTRVVFNNGFNPEWNKEFSFDIDASELELVFVRFRIYDKNTSTRNALICQRMIAFNAIAEGYRNIVLHDVDDKPIQRAKLVVGIQKNWESK